MGILLCVILGYGGDDEWREWHSCQDEARTHRCHRAACPDVTVTVRSL